MGGSDRGLFIAALAGGVDAMCVQLVYGLGHSK